MTFLTRAVFILSLMLLQTACSESEQDSTTDAQDFPTKSIRVIIPFGPGGLADVSMRLVGEALGDILGERLVMENRPGAGGVAATTTMLNADADGHTLIVLTNGTTIAETLFENLPYRITEELIPISAVAWFDLVLLTNPDTGYNSLQELLSAKGDDLKIATINPGSTQNLTAELFSTRANINATIIPYRTTPDTLGALLRNEVDLVIDAFTALKGAIDNNQAQPLAVTGESRNPALPDIPTTQEAGIEDFVVTGWNALYTKAGTDPEIISRLNQEISSVLANDEIKTRFAELGIEARATTPEEMQQQLLSDIEKWRQVIIDSGIDTL